MDIWDSVSARGDPSKRRKIDETSRFVRSDPDPASDESGVSQPRGRPERSTRRRTRSEVAHKRKSPSLPSDHLPNNGNDYEFGFTYPVPDDTVGTRLATELRMFC